MVTRHRGTCKSIVSNLTSARVLLIPYAKAMRPFFNHDHIVNAILRLVVSVCILGR
jgi:hypothetical protein